MRYIIVIFLFVIMSCNKHSNSSDSFCKQTERLELEIQLKQKRNNELKGKLELLFLNNSIKTGPFLKQMQKVSKKTINAVTILKSYNENFQLDSALIEYKNYIEWVSSTFYDHGFIFKQVEIMNSQLVQIENLKIKTPEENDYFFKRLIVDLLELEYELCDFILKIIHEDDFMFNYLEPVLVPDKPITKRGNYFTGRILLSAKDTTQNGIVAIIEGNDTIFIPFHNSTGIFKSKNKESGIHKVKGFYEHRMRYGRICKFPFEFEYYIE